MVVEIVVAFALIGGAAFGLAACTTQTGSGTSTPAAPITTAPPATQAKTQSTASTGGAGVTVTTSTGALDGLASPAEAVAAKLAPSVVNIAMSGTIAGPFGEQQSYSGEGSGVIYTADGMILTNNHVVTDDNGDPVGKLTVTLTTGEKLSATIVGRDPLTDLAVIKVNASTRLPVATFLNDQPTVGEYAVAIGSPLGYENSVTLGIVSGLARSIPGVTGTEGVALNNLIQTDAPISPGNSGGALANADGQVIGINVAYLPPASTGAVNIGFAIPAVVATQVADEIIKTGKATHAYLGVGTQTVTPDLQQQFGLSRSSGILVAEITPGGPADKAGIKQGDIVTKIDGTDMTVSSDLLVAIRDKKPGDTVQVTIDRNGSESTVAVTLEERPANLQ
ncbi:MAG: trypsin-like peptidase domain-containing protein [Actinobacteria bacterium]|nr:trypsin-like peptidase domain-containing protein [Actinomycetota bacterium]